jgi:hypothetical protein
MSTTLAGPVSAAQSWTNATRMVLAAVAIVILLAGSFVLGRVTVGTRHGAANPTNTATQTSTGSCHVARPC